MAEPDTRPAPKRNIYVPSDPFWDGARAGKLVLQFCLDTGRYQHLPRPVSIYTGSRNIEWREASGRGTIYARTVIRVPGAGVAGRLPLVAATVELEEGVRIIANIIGSQPDAVKIGLPVELCMDHLDGGVPYPAFRLVEAA
jgi:uncharacterized OB-fold protein